MSETRICDVMHVGVVSCGPEDALQDVADLMTKNQIRSVVVQDQTREAWGLISVMDLIPYYGKDLSAVTAEEAMRPYSIDIEPTAPIEDAIALMKRYRFEHLMIIDPNVGPKIPVGILTSYDIVQYMSGLNVGEYRTFLKMDEQGEGS